MDPAAPETQYARNPSNGQGYDTGAQDKRQHSIIGLVAATALKRAIEGKSKSEALNICNNFAGIDHSVPCQIQLVGGNVSIIPSNPN